MNGRLEEIKIWVANFVGNEDTDYPTLRLDDYEWLIQQAEKSEELQAKVEELEKQYSTRLGKFLKIQEENQRYKEALEFYANESNHEYEVTYDMADVIESEVMKDYGEKASKALKGVEV